MKKKFTVCICIILLSSLGFSQQNSTNQGHSYGQDLVQGLEAYQTGNWEDALFFLKRTSSYQDASSDSVWYFVIMAEMNISDYNAALRDGNTFLEIYSDSVYTPEITFQTLYAKHELGMYDESIIGFNNFVASYPNHDLIPAAMFYTGDGLYNIFEFAQSKQYFNTIISNYPNSDKYDDAAFRLELLEQREREEKLLYLLRVTGEEAFAAKEDYERQIMQLQSEEALILRKRLEELEQEHSKLQIEKNELLTQNENLRKTIQELNTIAEQNAQMPQISTSSNVVGNNSNSVENVTSNNDLIDELSQKALELQNLLLKN